MLLNPMTSLVTLYHRLFFFSEMPDLKLLVSLAIFAAVFFAGYLLFMSRKKEFVDLI